MWKGFEIFVETPDYYTIRARSPKEDFTFAGMDMTHKTFDFALCRTESDYTDGRHPDRVEAGTIESDLSRRDFTMNAIAMREDGTFIDPFDGISDIEKRTIRCVGDTETRMKEDGLRIMRALRFSVQLRYRFSPELLTFLKKTDIHEYLNRISVNRISDELYKAFQIDTHRSLSVLSLYPFIQSEIFKGDLWLMPTLKGRKQKTVNEPLSG